MLCGTGLPATEAPGAQRLVGQGRENDAELGRVPFSREAWACLGTLEHGRGCVVRRSRSASRVIHDSWKEQKSDANLEFRNQLKKVNWQPFALNGNVVIVEAAIVAKG